MLVLFAGVLAGCISGHGTQEAKLNIMDDNYRNYYEIFVGSFYDSDGDGMGDLKGVEEKAGLHLRSGMQRNLAHADHAFPNLS